jgi:hypothetical protein
MFVVDNCAGRVTAATASSIARVELPDALGRISASASHRAGAQGCATIDTFVGFDRLRPPASKRGARRTTGRAHCGTRQDIGRRHSQGSTPHGAWPDGRHDQPRPAPVEFRQSQHRQKSVGELRKLTRERATGRATARHESWHLPTRRAKPRPAWSRRNLPLVAPKRAEAGETPTPGPLARCRPVAPRSTRAQP